jgi:hypothetical protein
MAAERKRRAKDARKEKPVNAFERDILRLCRDLSKRRLMKIPRLNLCRLRLLRREELKFLSVKPKWRRASQPNRKMEVVERVYLPGMATLAAV